MRTRSRDGVSLRYRHREEPPGKAMVQTMLAIALAKTYTLG